MKNAISTAMIVLIATSFASAQSRSRSRDRERSSVAKSNRSDTGDFSQDYAIFSDVNIFQRERHRAQLETPQRQLTPEETYVLTGIVQDLDNQYRANFENRARGGVQKVSVGSTLALGKIIEIRADQALYEANSKKVWVQIGSNLTGANASSGSDSNSGSTPSGPPIDPNTPGLTMEQRMRARRMQQVPGGANPTISSSAAPAMGTPPANGFSSGSVMPPMGQPPMGQPPQPNGSAVDSVNGPPQQPTQNGAPPGAGTEGVAPADASEPNVIHNFPALPPQAPAISPQGNY